jgi:hypothetical protein
MTLALGTLSVGRPRKHGHGHGRKVSLWKRLQPLGLGFVTFGVATGTALALTAQPQKLFKPKRLVLDIARNGTTSTGAILVTSINIGADNMLVTSGAVSPIPAALFQNTGVDLNMQFSVCTPGITVQVGLLCSLAPSSTDTIVVSGAMSGSARENSAPADNF